jgi:hypothetical protein
VRQRGALVSIGITSPCNVAFCEGLGCYDKVVTYAEIASLDADQPVVMVDMAGSAQVLSDVRQHYGDNMKYSCRVGATHYDEMGATTTFDGYDVIGDIHGHGDSPGQWLTIGRPWSVPPSPID